MSDTAPTTAATDETVPPAAADPETASTNEPAAASSDQAASSDEPAAPASAADQLRAAEDKYLGPDVPRVDGKVEEGIGSKFRNIPEEHRAHLIALRALAVIEAEVLAAKNALAAAEAKVEHAVASVEAAAAKVI